MKKIFFTLFIIIFLSLFSSRYVNYDDYLYFFSSNVLQNKNIFEFPKTEFVFNGLELTPSDGTHTILPYLIFHFLYKMSYGSMIVLHLYCYSFAVLIFIVVSFYLKKLKVNNHDLVAFLFTLNPAFALYYNSFMMDSLFFLSFLVSYILLENFFEKQNIKSFLLFLFFFSFSILLSYINLFLVLTFFFQLKNLKKGYFICFLLFLISLLFFIKVFNLGADIFRALKWEGSERLLNYHKTFRKIIGYTIWIGLFSIPFISYRNLKDPLFYLSIVISIIYFIVLEQNVVNILIGTALLSTGLFSIYRIMFESDDDKIKIFFALFSLSIISLSPMIIGRYLYISYFFYFVIFSKLFLKNVNLKFSFFSTIVLIFFLFYSDLLTTNSYRNLNFTKTEKGYFIGEWGYRFIAEKNGLKPVKRLFKSLPESSIVYISDIERMYSPDKDFIVHLKPLVSESLNNFFFKTISKINRCGFYTDLYGVLPFSLGDDFSISHTEYLFLKNGNPNFLANRERLAFIGSEAVIISKITDTVRVLEKNFDKIKVCFFDDYKVLKRSDGIKLFIHYSDGETEEFLIKTDGDGLLPVKNKRIDLITFDKNGNDRYDWFGITFY
ncbi:MAG: hypothetical protein ABIN00_06605 [candidate division WOR-3 bacterium]